MIVLYLVLLVAVILVNRSLFGSAIKPTDIFTLIWCVFAGLTSCGMFGFYPTGTLTNILIIVPLRKIRIMLILT